ncbi:hypothetical protein CWB41_14145 [Methylovirgula ligni]|uniref:Uncharacterized protein n=1 Tax=Methylovirgula ligni TaxID=569860 RepID=A0A3D9YL13_9HYPH|nr:hypothetical protein [Methylovirgula ligni]QAY96732.1 hypothetical protein CWB41_14145 [Methylovirgula ligni]REF83224.1 hypothetical protein DES32_3140 [Methylovirgula ligni]
MPWSDPLSAPITLHDGRVLKTLNDAAQLFLRLSETIQRHDWNQYAAELLIDAAKSGKAGDIRAATMQVQRALGREGML